MLNPHSPIPLYRQLGDLLMEKIRSGEYPAGSRIPSEPWLAAAYGIGRPTVRQAVQRLVQQGMLTRRRGSGTYVEAVRPEVDLFSLGGTLSAFQKKGLLIAVQVVRPMGLAGVVQDPENPFSGKPAYIFTRLTRVEEIPALMETLYFHAGIFKDIDTIDSKYRSLSEVVRDRYYMKPSGGRQNFRIGYLSKTQAGLLEIPIQTPVLVVNRYLHFPQAENAVYSEMFCRTDRFVFSQELEAIRHV